MRVTTRQASCITIRSSSRRISLDTVSNLNHFGLSVTLFHFYDIYITNEIDYGTNEEIKHSNARKPFSIGGCWNAFNQTKPDTAKLIHSHMNRIHVFRNIYIYWWEIYGQFALFPSELRYQRGRTRYPKKERESVLRLFLPPICNLM